jgi:cation/acetate symporter
MAALLAAEFLGGTPFVGFIAAVAFATILAVVAGLTLAAASAMAHDLFFSVVRGGQASEAEQVKVARIATVVFGLAAIALGIAFKGQNVAFMVGLAFAIACSGNFPALLLSITWGRFTTAGAVASIIVGSVSATALIILSPTVWADVFKFPSAVFPLKNPAIVSMPLAFATAYVASWLFPDPEAAAKFEAEKVRTYLGVGAE